MTYAARTRVPARHTLVEIEKTLKRYGATGFAYGDEGHRVMIGFQTANRRVRIVLPLKPPTNTNESQMEQLTRARWRGLLLSIKAKLETVESGIESFDEAFMPHIVMPNGKTMAEHALPYLKEAYASGKMPPLLSFGSST